MVATWNVANLGVHKRSDGDHRLIAEMVGWFDLVAIQEVADDLTGLRALGRSLMGPMVALALGSGARLGELLGAVWGAGLDLEAAVLRVLPGGAVDRVRGPDGAFARVDPKSRAAVRGVPLDPDDVAALRRHRLATGRPPDGALVFADARGEPLPPGGAVRRSWERIVRASGIDPPAPTLHHLRHAWAVAMLRAGVRPEAVAKLGGWADAGMVYRRYGKHALPDELADAGRRLAAWRASQRQG